MTIFLFLKSLLQFQEKPFWWQNTTTLHMLRILLFSYIVYTTEELKGQGFILHLAGEGPGAGCHGV